jgi:hypothetical protein
MKRRPVLIIAFACLASAILALVFWPREREPEYNGVTLSTWLVRSGSTNQTESLAAVDAIRHIGTNALPSLLRWIHYEPGWRDSLGRRIITWPIFGKSGHVQRLVWNMTWFRANAAVNGFHVLGSQANPALPELQRLAENPKMPETAIRATHCIFLMTQRFPEGDFDRNFPLIQMNR